MSCWKKICDEIKEIILLENTSIDPGTSCMQRGRSTSWANTPSKESWVIFFLSNFGFEGLLNQF